ncbi:MAG: YeeE/YedE thiosulfate transporter family protein [Gemmatimonadaceae bacterium]
MNGRRYADAGTMGIALGTVLFLSYLLAGRGLGASGAFAAVAGKTIGATLPNAVAGTPALADRIPLDATLLDNWSVLEIVGVFLGGALSAYLAGRWRRPSSEHVTASTWRTLLGGVLMGFGARLAYGCTSGLALSGGALLATGAWIFIPAAFGTAILLTQLTRRRRGAATP